MLLYLGYFHFTAIKSTLTEMTEEMVFVSLKHTTVFIKGAPTGYFERLINRSGIFYGETT